MCCRGLLDGETFGLFSFSTLLFTMAKTTVMLMMLLLVCWLSLLDVAFQHYVAPPLALHPPFLSSSFLFLAFFF